MAGRKPDRRIQKTIASLEAALMELVVEKGYENVTVQDILDRANVGRATFYCHFADKEELFFRRFRQFEEHLMDTVKSSQASTPLQKQAAFGFSLPFLRHAEEHRKVFQSLVGRKAGHIVQDNARQLILNIIRQELKARRPQSKDATAMEMEAQYFAGAFYSLLAWWMEGRPKLSAEELDGKFQELSFKALLAGKLR